MSNHQFHFIFQFDRDDASSFHFSHLIDLLKIGRKCLPYTMAYINKAI